MNNSTYMLRSAVIRMPIDAKFTTFSQQPMTRRQVARIGMRNRPVKAFRQIKSYVNGLISTRIPEELEWVEEHIEEDYAYGMDFPNDGECLPVVCAREYSTGDISSRSLVTTGQTIAVVANAGGAPQLPGVPGIRTKNIVSSTPSCNGVGIDIESTSNFNFLQRTHQFHEGFNLATQTWSGDIEFPVRVGAFQPYRSDKNLGNSMIPYVGEATLEFDWRQYQSKDSDSSVYKVNGSTIYTSPAGANYWVGQPVTDRRVPVDQKRHMDVSKYLFESGGALAAAARTSGGFGMRGRTEPFCLCIDDGIRGVIAQAAAGNAEDSCSSFMIVPYDEDVVCDWYTGDNQVGYIGAAPPADGATIVNTATKSKCGLVTGFPDFESVKKTFPDGTIVNFDTDWLIDNTALTASMGLPAQFVVGNTEARNFSALNGGNVDIYGAGTAFFNTGAFGQATHHDNGVQWATQRADALVTPERVNAGSVNFIARGNKINEAQALVNFDGQHVAASGGRRLQLANAVGLASTKVYFEPNSLKIPTITQNGGAGGLDREKNPRVHYAVWEVYDPVALSLQAREHARKQFQQTYYGGTAAQDPSQETHKINEIAWILNRQNLKSGQTIAAWIPTAVIHNLFVHMDNAAQDGQTVVGGLLQKHGNCPLYALGDTDVLRRTYSGENTLTRALRTTIFNTDAISVGAGNRRHIWQILGYEVEKVTGVNPFGATGNGHLDTFTVIGGLANGHYGHSDYIIPRGTRIRLKQYTHVGISADTQCLGPPNANPQAYKNPTQLKALLIGSAGFQNAADLCVDFNWEEQRGRFPYQVIQPRFDGYKGLNTPSKQGGRGFIYEDAVKNIQLRWRQQPELVCEWIILPRSKVQPTYRLAYPQHQFFRCLFPSPTFNLPRKGESHEVAIRGLQINEVPNKIYVYCQLTEASRNYLEWLDIKPTIKSIETTINETVDTTSHIPTWLGFRFFKENCPYSQKTRDEWLNDNCWVLSPQQLNITPETFTESMARVSTISMKATVEMNRAYKQISSNYSPALFPGLESTGKSVMTPTFEMRVVITYDNRSLLVNSKNEMIVEKNTLATRGPTGLIRSDRDLPRQGGLMLR